MKKFVSSLTAFVMAAGQANAGGLDEPVIEAIEVVDESSSAGWLIPLLAIAVVALVVSNDSDDPKCPPGQEYDSEKDRCFSE